MTTELRAGRLLVALAFLAAALPAMADTKFRVRKMTRDDVPLGTGQCDIRLQIDGEAEVSLRGDTVFIRTISGRDGRDDGSECNEPLPGRDIQDFRFEVRDRRGDIRLLSEPSRRTGYSAVVRIRDSQGGEGRYHFRIKWTLTGGGGFRRPERGGLRPPPRGRADTRWEQTINYTGRGQGRFFRTGEGRRRITAVVVRMERSGAVYTDLMTDRGRVSFSGRIVRVLGNGRVAALMRSRDGAEGEMLFVVRGNRVRDISMNSRSGRDRIELNWSES